MKYSTKALILFLFTFLKFFRQQSCLQIGGWLSGKMFFLRRYCIMQLFSSAATPQQFSLSMFARYRRGGSKNDTIPICATTLRLSLRLSPSYRYLASDLGKGDLAQNGCSCLLELQFKGSQRGFNFLLPFPFFWQTDHFHLALIKERNAFISLLYMSFLSSVATRPQLFKGRITLSPG